MFHHDMHLPDEQLLQLGDGELSAQDAARAGRHLAACWDCRSRKEELERTIGEFIHLHHDTLDGQMPPAAGPRALLKARLHAGARATGGSWWRRAETALVHRRSYLYAALAAMLASMTFLVYQMELSIAPPRAQANVRLVPNSSLTPGATRPVGWTEICKAEPGERDPTLPHEVRRSVFREYGMQNSPEKNYEVDYLIAPELGGTSDLRNLWPEPYSSTIWNANVKDALEDRLHDLVCKRKIDLTTAQHDLATDWISAYKKYFHTQKPLSTSSLDIMNRISTSALTAGLPSSLSVGL